MSRQHLTLDTPSGPVTISAEDDRIVRVSWGRPESSWGRDETPLRLIGCDAPAVEDDDVIV